MIVYDRYQKKTIQRKWCRVVSYIAREPLDTNAMPRKITVFLAAPPGDGLSASREHFTEYVKPILVAGALDWDVVEGRREGDVRAGLAERVRMLRKRAGEVEKMPGSTAEEEDVVDEIRQKGGVHEWSGVKGDIVIGRHTWKEYIRGLHEGWLGSLDEPSESSHNHHQSSTQESSETHKDVLINDDQSLSHDSSSSSSSPPSSSASPDPPSPLPPEPTTKPSKSPTPTPFISTTSYASASLPPSIPDAFEPTTPLPQPHILGFLNTPIRIYRFLNRRHLADRIGREAAAVVLATSTRPYRLPSTSSSNNHDPAKQQGEEEEEGGEIPAVLLAEEKDWHKSISKRVAPSKVSPDDENENKAEKIWTDPMVLDERIVSRMRRFELDPEAERRAERIARGEEEVEEDSEWGRQTSTWKRWWGILSGSKGKKEVRRRTEEYADE